MNLLPIRPSDVEDCRHSAASIADAMQKFINQHSTVSIERTILLFYGVAGANADGIPLINLCVEQCVNANIINQGVAYQIAQHIKAGSCSPQESAEKIGYGGEIIPITITPQEAIDILKPFTKQAMEKIDSSCHQRTTTMEGFESHEQKRFGPLKYVIVATGNIHDDAVQAQAAAQSGADIIAVIRSTAQSLLDYVPIGATTEGFGGTWATQENFRIVRAALDIEQEKQGRYLHLVNYSSGLCMAEIAYMAAIERLDMLLNDAMYGILFRDINPRRTLLDQYVSRRIIARANMVINTGEDNYLTTADAIDAAHTVIVSHFINEAFATQAGLQKNQMGLGHAFEIDKNIEDSFLFEIAQAQLVRQLFPDHPIKWMPSTKHKTGDIFWSHRVDGMFDLIGIMTGQSIELLGMMTEAIHTPFLHDRFIALKSADYIFKTARHLGDEISWKPEGIVVKRAQNVLSDVKTLLQEIEQTGFFSAIAKGSFGDVCRTETGGKGADGVFERHKSYVNPILDELETNA